MNSSDVRIDFISLVFYDTNRFLVEVSSLNKSKSFLSIGVRAGGAGRGGGGLQPPQNFGRPRFFGQQEKFGQRQLFKMFSSCFLNR